MLLLADQDLQAFWTIGMIFMASAVWVTSRAPTRLLIPPTTPTLT